MPLNIQRFDKFTDELVNKYNQLYSFKNLLPSIHKNLVHAGELQHLINNVFGDGWGLGIFSEESLEAENKVKKSIYVNNTCKTSPKMVMEDMIHYLMMKSDLMKSEDMNIW